MKFLDKLQPAPLDGGFKDPGHWIWCGSVIAGPEGRFHMFASMWPKSVPFSPNWLTNSRVVRAVADKAEGPYRYAEDVLPPHDPDAWDGKMSHNPTIHKSGDTYLLYYTGSTYPGPMPTDGRPNDDIRLTARANQRIGLATAPSPEGPWTRQDKPILEPRPGKWDGLITTNPAPCVLEDGRVLLLYKSVPHDKGKLQYGVAMAERFDAPYERLQDEPIFQFDDPTLNIEDAYVWRQDGRFYLLLNDMTGKITGEDHAGALGVSDDGIHWQIADPPKAYSRQITWEDGSVTKQGSFERPQLLIQDGKPTHLFAATGDGPGGFWNASKTWNMVVPLA